jgi:hypothetical protein
MFSIPKELPDLKGTPKQIAWAEKIRKELLGKAPSEEYLLRYRHSLAGGLQLGSEDPRIQAAMDKIAALWREHSLKTSAAWWIDNRNLTLMQIMAEPYQLFFEDLFSFEIEAKKRAADAVNADLIQKRNVELLEKAKAEALDKGKSEATAALFIPLRLERLQGNDFVVYGENGQMAKGCLEDGEAVVYEISGQHIHSTLENAERLNHWCTSKYKGMQ